MATVRVVISELPLRRQIHKWTKRDNQAPLSTWTWIFQLISATSATGTTHHQTIPLPQL